MNFFIKFFKSFFKLNGQRGNIALAMGLATAGASLLLISSQYTSVARKAINHEIAEKKNYLGTANNNAIAVAAQLFSTTAANTAATLYPSPYIPDDGYSLETARSVNAPAATGELWNSNGTSLSVRVANTQDLSAQNQAAIFQQIHTGGSSVTIGGQTVNLTIKGYETGTGAQSNLIKAVYLEAQTQPTSSNGQSQTEQQKAIAGATAKSQTMIAKVNMSAPPPSDCYIKLSDPANGGGPYTTPKKTKKTNVAVIANQLSLDVYCNNVVTKLDVLRDNILLAGGHVDSPTNARWVDSTNYHSMLPAPIMLTASASPQTITVSASQPDGNSITSDVTLNQQPVVPPDPSKCASKCTTQTASYMGQCAGDKNAAKKPACWQHVKDYQDWFGNAYWYCFNAGINDPANGMPGEMAGFDPTNNCSRSHMYYRDNGGCFVGETKIKMGDGSLKSAETIIAGDQVFSPLVGGPVRVEKVVAGPEYADLFTLSIGDRMVKVSSEHPFMTLAGPVAVHNLQKGDMILDVDGQYHAITAIDKIAHAKPVKVWNFVLQGGYDVKSHLLVGDGLVSGDLVIQKQPVDRALVNYAFDLEK